MSTLTAQFKTYLANHNQANQKLAPATVKNYVSDVQVFLDWLKRELQEDTIVPANLTAAVFGNYGRRLNDPANRVLPSTARRYLSSLKRFGGWLEMARLADTNPAAALPRQQIDPTISRLMNNFKHELVRQKLSASTIKNYVSDVHNYLLWATKQVKITDNNLIKL